MNEITHEYLWMVVKKLPEDYAPYGSLERSTDIGDVEYFGPDCSMGCCWYIPLVEPHTSDWGVCTNPKSHRCGLLTWEHIGCLHYCGCFDGESYIEGYPELRERLEQQKEEYCERNLQGESGTDSSLS